MFVVKKMKTWLFCFLAVLLVWQTAVPVSAASYKDDDNQEMENGEDKGIGDTTINVEKNGTITITMTAKTATANWRWRTIGYYLTQEPLAVSKGNLTGSAGKGVRANQVIWLSHHTCSTAGCPFKGRLDGDPKDVKDKPNKGYTTTTIVLTKECIDAHRQAAGATTTWTQMNIEKKEENVNNLSMYKCN